MDSMKCTCALYGWKDCPVCSEEVEKRKQSAILFAAMGVNPHKRGPTPPKMKPFSIELFVDVYNAYKKEFGEEYMARHVGAVAMFLDDKSGRIECCGTYPVLRCLTSLLVMRLATTQAELVYEKSQGKNNPGLKETAKLILEEVQNDINRINDFDHQYNTVDKKIGLATSS